MTDHIHEWHYSEPKEHYNFGHLGARLPEIRAQRYCWCGVLEEKELKKV